MFFLYICPKALKIGMFTMNKWIKIRWIFFSETPSLYLVKLSWDQITCWNRIHVYQLCIMSQLTENHMLVILLFCSVFVHMSKKSNINAIAFQEEINVSNSIFKKAIITMLADQSNNSVKITDKQLTLELDFQTI